MLRIVSLLPGARPCDSSRQDSVLGVYQHELDVGLGGNLVIHDCPASDMAHSRGHS